MDERSTGNSMSLVVACTDCGMLQHVWCTLDDGCHMCLKDTDTGRGGSTAFRERNSSSGQNSRNGTLWVILYGGGMVTDEAQCDESLACTVVRTQVGVIIGLHYC